MSLICRWFGHNPRKHSYGNYYGGVTDGIGINHAFFTWDCERCEEKIFLYTNVPTEFRTEYQWTQESTLINRLSNEVTIAKDLFRVILIDTYCQYHIRLKGPILTGAKFDFSGTDATCEKCQDTIKIYKFLHSNARI